MGLFDLKHILLARHAQHVVIIHFPIALLLASFLFDVLALWKKNTALSVAARYNLTGAALTAVLALGTGLIAWQWQLAGAKLKGPLLLHLLFATASCGLIWMLWFWRVRKQPADLMGRGYVFLALLTTILIMATAHLGGFLSGVNA